MTSLGGPPQIEFQAAVREFLNSRRVDAGASRLTIEAYARDLRALSLYLSGKQEAGIILNQIAERDLSGFLSSLRAAKHRATSIARRVSVLRQFFKFCVVEYRLSANPAELIESPKIPKRLPKALTQEQVQALIQASIQGLEYREESDAAREALRSRDRSMLLMLYATGLRVSELTGLLIGNIDTELGYLRVKGKGDKERIVPYAKLAGEALAEYLQNRPTLKPTDEHLYSNARDGAGLTRQSAWMILKKLAEMAGLGSRVTPHVLRHSFATHLLHAGMNLRSLQMLLGHSDLSTTQIYTGIAPEHLKEAHRKFHPRGED